MDLKLNDTDIHKIKKVGDYIRILSLESIERAKSGHPGLPLGCAELGVLIYRYLLKFSPTHPQWINRDRFILSAGHGSMLLYSLLHLTQYPISLEDLAQFRQLGSKTAGHPEYDIPLGIETTTGPLGQGFTNAVGCAIEGKFLAARFNKKDNSPSLLDYTVFTLMGDGCNMEGISYEAGSLAGHLGLDNLVAIYDSNNISIDGKMDITFTEDVGKRYEAMGWHVEHTDIQHIQDVLSKLLLLKEMKQGKPKLLIVKTTIGEGLKSKKGTPDIHGAPAGLDEIAYFIQNSNIRELFENAYGKEAIEDTDGLKSIIEKRVKEKKEGLLEFPEAVQFMKEGVEAGNKAYDEWVKITEDLKKNSHQDYEEFHTFFNTEFPSTLRQELLNYKESKADATRNISGKILNLCAGKIPHIVGGCADLKGSTKAEIKGSPYMKRDDFSGRNIAFGVREHAMGAIGNGLTLNRTLIPFTSTFFTFFDYMKPAIRLAALMKLRHLFIFTHDSIYVGEDGPTHQPIEHLNAMRLIPGLYTFRPANDIETAFTYLYFLEEMNGPAAIINTRQTLSESMFNHAGDREEMYTAFKKGGYIFYETQSTVKPDIVLCGSGSELSTAMEAARLIEERDKKSVRVVSIPCLELLNEKGDEYRRELFPEGVRVIMIEAASYRGVEFFNSSQVTMIKMDRFGLSAPDKKVCEYFGFTPEAVYQKIK